MFEPIREGSAQVEWLPQKQKRKGKKAARTCEVSQELYGLILELKGDQLASEKLFPYSEDWIKEKLNKILHDFDHTSHDLRHTRLTDLSNAGMDLVTLQNFAGHSDPKTTSKYVTVSKEDLIMKVREIDKRLKINSVGQERLEERRDMEEAQGRGTALGKRVAREAPIETE